VKVAVIGAGISGLAAAHALQHDADVTVFEAARRIGGHTDTHAILTGGRTYRVDSGFIVFNHDNYPGFSAWLDENRYRNEVLLDLKAGVDAGITGTPGFFINGRALRGAVPFEYFEAVIEDELAKLEG